MSNNRIATEPQLKDVLNELRKEIFINLNCHAIAKIDSFNPTDQTCVAALVYKKKFTVLGDNGAYSSKLVSYPAVIDCPVITLSGGKAGITMPIKSGDDCLLLFNDRDIDNWFSGAVDGEVATSRLHSFSDAIALVGLNSLSSSIVDYSADDLVLYNETTKISLSNQKITLENAIESFMAIQEAMFSALTGFTSTNCAVGAPVAMSPATIAELEAVKARFQALLE